MRELDEGPPLPRPPQGKYKSIRLDALNRLLELAMAHHFPSFAPPTTIQITN